MDKERKWLLSSIKTLLLPELLQRGFVVLPLEDHDGETRRLMPFRLRRVGLDGTDLIEVWIHKYRYAFTLCMGRIPKYGTMSAGRLLPQTQIRKLADMDIHFWTAPRLSIGYGHYSVRRWPWKKITETDYDDLVKRFINIIPEIEQALVDGRRGPHIRLADLRGRLHYGEREDEKN